MLRQECPASLFEREAEVLFGALKTKSCLSVASSFCLAKKSAGVAQKVQTAVFLFCYIFLSADRKKKVIIIDFPNKGTPYLLISATNQSPYYEDSFP